MSLAPREATKRMTAACSQAVDIRPMTGPDFTAARSVRGW
jgi:hypothetical protein